VKECKEICSLFNRDYLNFEVTLQKTNDRLGTPKVRPGHLVWSCD
jgi:hypothetical protein